MAKKLCTWSCSFINDPENLPFNLYGSWNASMLESRDLVKAIHEHLMGIGEYVSAAAVVRFVNSVEIKNRYSLKRNISLATAQQWMHTVGYRWQRSPTGQYVDGHEHSNVVVWKQDGTKEERDGPCPQECRTVIWYHDELTFYANDQQHVHWVHTGENAVPQSKGEGASLMVANFVSADYGWLQSLNGATGKARDGYFTNSDILEHATKAMNILKDHFPYDKHILIFDNVTTHLKRPDNALSAQKMPKFPSKSIGPSNFGVLWNKLDANGKLVYGVDGKVIKEKVWMAPPVTVFSDGEHPDHAAGVFKGMVRILEEHRYHDIQELRAECPRFKCSNDTSCCCYPCGFRIIFLPKFHCELSPIEQYWGHTKCIYRDFPPSSKEADLEQNVKKALAPVSIQSIRCATHRFMDAYQKGLSGKQASWAAKIYHGHHTLSDTILDQLDNIK
ncbi:hypothetical protein HETIRDRAFT_421108 [Heterobasidion irregulare TC 32-1]|uniref:Tc1-like transposase DDE domain-containing protein n=1 Tax=Heterobasidion irregulare (strain TC 32-1) TaxID=747525 RepID=W4JXW2_HETIT|nr:uncharacterized protein HETIRDRAFT_421108 [Heterobasidion irregulare TC 32-1]ETW78373.1 hypothetical protein HETIRDRAFT_421108 [Heterobasidion irregulare TC 32-1]